ncbi:hypothetical protein Goari_026764 [Gossypium aridum]|uniref:Uncharacterized protein n=1 Tax=Gossypium aridum TaxID=34290 RepID=A0A7J8YTQ0_GOSAI|nr:hypothetical protein [Gossypium aridum]
MDREYIGLAFVLYAPLFWISFDKFYFIINLNLIMKCEEIWWHNLDKCLNLLQKKYLYN